MSRLTEEREAEIRQVLVTYVEEIQELLEDLDALRDENAKLKQALTWYRDATAYSNCSSERCIDNGKRAMEALAQDEEEK